MQVFSLVGASFTLVTLLMFGFWIAYLFGRRAGIADIAWGIGFIITSWVYFVIGTGNTFKMLVLTLMVTTWAARLTYHMYNRYRRCREHDPRYQAFLESWDPDSARLYFFMVYLFQGVLIVILSIPFLLVSLGSNGEWSRFELWGIVIWAIGAVGEAIADHQLEAFARVEANKGNVCQNGLWRYSRHPNYFFEVVLWFGFAIYAIPSEWGALSMISPIIILILLWKVSGIPLAEAQSLRTKGEQYREYQRSTSVFIPWFPKK